MDNSQYITEKDKHFMCFLSYSFSFFNNLYLEYTIDKDVLFLIFKLYFSILKKMVC